MFSLGDRAAPVASIAVRDRVQDAVDAVRHDVSTELPDGTPELDTSSPVLAPASARSAVAACEEAVSALPDAAVSAQHAADNAPTRRQGSSAAASDFAIHLHDPPRHVTPDARQPGHQPQARVVDPGPAAAVPTTPCDRAPVPSQAVRGRRGRVATRVGGRPQRPPASSGGKTPPKSQEPGENTSGPRGGQRVRAAPRGGSRGSVKLESAASDGLCGAQKKGDRGGEGGDHRRAHGTSGSEACRAQATSSGRHAAEADQHVDKVPGLSDRSLTGRRAAAFRRSIVQATGLIVVARMPDGGPWRPERPPGLSYGARMHNPPGAGSSPLTGPGQSSAATRACARRAARRRRPAGTGAGGGSLEGADRRSCRRRHIGVRRRPRQCGLPKRA